MKIKTKVLSAMLLLSVLHLPVSGQEGRQSVLAQNREASYDKMERGLSYFQQGLYSRAVAEYSDAIKLDPRYELYIYRGQAYRADKQYDLAMADFNTAIQDDANSNQGFFNRALVYLEEGMLPDAIADFTEAIRLNPADASAYVNRGVSNMQRQQYNLALPDFTMALQIRPDFIEAWYNRGLVYHLIGDDAKAKLDWEAGLKIDPNYTLIKDNIGVLN
ncbi:MAG: tetratricopeptide repeat protein [Spirochaetaceae bacterium]|jgi:tetratricopeptide (TPR) repeat protein|nr:tetratricopeptide repeat protein [Spirochaetaceae bacterium]